MIILENAHTIIVVAGLAVLMAGLLHLRQKLLRWGRCACRKAPD